MRITTPKEFCFANGIVTVKNLPFEIFCNIFLALTSESTLSVGAFCIFGTVVHSSKAFLNVSAVITITNESSITSAFIATWGVVAGCVCVTVVVTSSTLVDIHTGKTVTKEAFVTNTLVTSFFVVASGEHRTSLATHHHSSALILIRACFTSTKVTVITCTSE